MPGAPNDVLVTSAGATTIHTIPSSNAAGTSDTVALPFQGVTGGVPLPSTSLSSGAITNPTSTLTRPASAVSASVTATNAAPCVFTWIGNPLVNGQGVYLGGSAVPTGFTAGTTYFVVVVAGNTFQLSATVGGASIASTSTGTAVTATFGYKPNDLIATATSSPIVPSFAIATTAGGAIIPRLRLRTNVTGVPIWTSAILSVNLWSAAPTYTGGDGQLYTVATGSASWLANFIISLNQFGDGAVGAGQITGANEMALKLASGTSVFWDLQIMSFMTPIVSQTFTLTAELLN